jgi:hypothetical protein
MDQASARAVEGVRMCALASLLEEQFRLHRNTRGRAEAAADAARRAGACRRRGFACGSRLTGGP